MPLYVDVFNYHDPLWICGFAVGMLITGVFYMAMEIYYDIKNAIKANRYLKKYLVHGAHAIRK